MNQQYETNDSQRMSAAERSLPTVDATSTPLKTVAAADEDRMPYTHAEDADTADVQAEGTPLPEFWAALKRMPRYARLSANLARDGRVPRRAKVALAAGGAYAVSPIDLVPGVIPVAGQLDDLFVVMTAIQHAVKASPPEVAAEQLERAGLTHDDVDADMEAVRATIGWLVKRGVKIGGNMAATGIRKVQALLRSRG